MAKRLKTIEYALSSSMGGPIGAAQNLGTGSIYIPETNSRIFRSVTMVVGVQDGLGTAASLTSASLSIGLAGAADSVLTNTTTITNSGENQAFIFLGDFTGYFAANFATGSVVTARAGCKMGVISLNAYGKLIITYEFDDAGQSTFIKTVRIPIEGNTGSLTSAYTAVGQRTSNIPALDTFLPETSKVYRSIFLETLNNEDRTGATAMNLYYRHDGATDITQNFHTGTLISARNFYRVDNVTPFINTTTARTLESKTSATPTAFFSCLSPILNVTYEYTGSSANIMNSIIVPFGGEDTRRIEDGATNKTRLFGEFWIPEDNPMLVQSAVMFSANSLANSVFNCAVGSQPNRAYTFQNPVRCGGLEWSIRADYSGALSIAKGYNTCSADIYTTTAADESGLSAILYLNYTSSLMSGGPEVHNKTILYNNKTFAANSTRHTVTATSSITPNIPETNYFISAGPWYTGYYMWPGATQADTFVAISAECAAGEGKGSGGGGWFEISDFTNFSDGEVGFNVVWANCRDVWKLYPNDPDTTKMDIETTRDWRYYLGPTGYPQGMFGFTYHSQLFSISGTVSNYSGAGSGIVVKAHDAITGVVINTATTAAGGGYNMQMFDNGRQYYVEAYQDSTHVGRSSNDYPTRQ